MKCGIFHNHKGVFFIIGLYLIIGISTFIKYGVSWDEAISRNNGVVSYNYIFNHDKSLDTYQDRDYGVAIELPLFIGEKLLKIQSADTRKIFLYRHISIHFVFLLSAVFFYFICNDVFNNKTISFIGLFIYLCCPVIYTHSFYNTKDVGFLSVYVISSYFSLKYLISNKFLYLILSAITIAMLINIRIIGVQLFLMVVCVDVIFNFLQKKSFFGMARPLALVLISSVFLYITWPYLWNNPFDKFISAFNNMAHFRWNLNLLYLGKMVLATKLPWHYSIIWFLLSIPIVFLLLGFIGMLYALKLTSIWFFESFIKGLLYKDRAKIIIALISLGVVLGSFASFIILHVVLYDGWRHFYYVYPFFVIFILFFIDYIGKNKKLYSISLLFLFFQFVLTSYGMIKNYPFNQVYMNEISWFWKKDQRRTLFESDYWGNSSYMAINYLLNEYPRRNIKVGFLGCPKENNWWILSDQEKNRLQVVEDIKTADFIITNFRFHPENYTEYGNPIYTLSAYGSIISAIYKHEIN